jgi:hypothetical protein
MLTAAYSILEFCRAHRISRAHLYNLMKRGQGPVVMKAGNRTLISDEAAIAWRRRMESGAQQRCIDAGGQ